MFITVLFCVFEIFHTSVVNLFDLQFLLLCNGAINNPFGGKFIGC